MRVINAHDSIIISNRALSVEWRTVPWFKIVRATDLQAGRTLAFRSDLFEIVLTNGARYPLSKFAPESGPRFEKSKRVFGVNPAAQATVELVEFPLRSSDGRLRILWRAVARDGANYLRQELEIKANGEEIALQAVRWFNEPIAGAHTAGQVDGSPVVAGTFFMGCEDPHAVNMVVSTNAADRAGCVSCAEHPQLTLRPGEQVRMSFVLGVAPEAQLRRGFLYYLERERAHPYRPFLHYNSWYDIAWEPFALNETNCLEAIRLVGERLIKAHGVHLDAMVFDDGWDNPHTLWQFHQGFPNGFGPLAALCKHYGTHLGVWLSPFGGYGEPRKQRLTFGAAQGYETNATGFSLAGPKYYAAFERTCESMIRDYGVNHFKFDGIATGMYARGGAQYYRDTEAMRRLMLELRQVDPNLYINLTTGSWPSPFWLRYADSVWRQGDDMGFAGKGGRQQQWLTYRDQEVYRNIVRKGPLFPLNSLMTQGVAYSRKGTAGDPAFNSAGFKDDVRAFFGSGTGLQELYIQPGKLTAVDWAVLAEAAKWSRRNADVLVDTHWIGGDPARGELYGYASWNAGKGILMLRNPDDHPQGFQLRLDQAFELPTNAPNRLFLKSPWREDSAKAARVFRTFSVETIQVPAFGVCIYEATPQ